MSNYLFLAVLVLQLADIGTTYFILRHGIGREANPLMAWLIDKLGLTIGLLLPKAAAVGALCLGMREDVVSTWALAFCIALYIWVVGNNCRVINRARPGTVNMLRLATTVLLLAVCQVAAIVAPIRALWALLTNNADRAFEIIKAYDLLGNAVLNGQFNELISTRANRARREGRRWGCILCRLLDSIDKDHCEKSPV